MIVWTLIYRIRLIAMIFIALCLAQSLECRKEILNQDLVKKSEIVRYNRSKGLLYGNRIKLILKYLLPVFIFLTTDCSDEHRFFHRFLECRKKMLFANLLSKPWPASVFLVWTLIRRIRLIVMIFTYLFLTTDCSDLHRFASQISLKCRKKILLARFKLCLRYEIPANDNQLPVRLLT